MATRVADRVVLDTNVLLAATNVARADHRSAVAALDAWPAAGTALYTSGQILREYLAVATRPIKRNGLGLAAVAAVANVRALRSRMRLLEENAKVIDFLVELLEEVDCTGKQIHDASIVATMVVHGVDTLVTANVTDFVRFEHRVRVVPLAP